MTTFSNIASSRTLVTAAITIAFAWECNIPLFSLRSLALTLGGQLAVHYLGDFASRIVHSVHAPAKVSPAEASNLIKLFNRIPLEKPAFTGSPEEQVVQIRSWMQKHAEALSGITSLDLNGQGLTAVPQEIRYFTSLIRLYLYHNRITSLANVTFPVSLQGLSISDNQITSLANVTFPVSLQDLDLGNNRITSLANVAFPASLRVLDLYHNPITSLANVAFPAFLLWLDLSSNQITSFANVNFPASLLKLKLGNNRITSLTNVTFPTSLQWFFLEGNQITGLTNVTFPASLQRLDLDRNQIISLAHVTFPVSLRTVLLSHNELADIGPLLNLSRNCDVDVEYNALTETYLETFQQALSARRNALNSIQGPQIHWTVDIPRAPVVHATFPAQTSSSLSSQLSAWAQEISKLSNGLQTNQFASLETSLSAEEKTNLANYLRRLREIKDYREGSIEAKQNITVRVARMLDLAARNREFKGKMLAAISQGLDTCGDRVLIIFNDIEILTQMYHEMTDDEAAKLAIRAQRYEELKKYAQNKARELSLGDEIETILYFQLKLRTKLDLPITTEGMLYPGVSGVTDTMLNEAESAMRNISNEKLLGKSDFWQARMKKYEKTIAAIKDEYAELLDNAEEYDKKSETERPQFLASHKKFKEMLEEYEEPFVYHKVAEAIGQARGIAIANVWKASAGAQHASTSLASSSTSSASAQTARSI